MTQTLPSLTWTMHGSLGQTVTCSQLVPGWKHRGSTSFHKPLTCRFAQLWHGGGVETTHASQAQGKGKTLVTGPNGKAIFHVLAPAELWNEAGSGQEQHDSPYKSYVNIDIFLGGFAASLTFFFT